MKKIVLTVIIIIFDCNALICENNNSDSLKNNGIGIFFMNNCNQYLFSRADFYDDCCLNVKNNSKELSWEIGLSYIRHIDTLTYFRTNLFLNQIPFTIEAKNTGATKFNSLGDTADIFKQYFYTLNYISFDLLYGFILGDNFNIMSGISLNYLIYNKLNILSIITNTNNVYYDDGTKEKQEAGTLKFTNNFVWHLKAGFSYNFYLDKNKKYFLAPELYYSKGISKVISFSDWKYDQIQLGVSLFYKF